MGLELVHSGQRRQGETHKYLFQLVMPLAKKAAAVTLKEIASSLAAAESEEDMLLVVNDLEKALETIRKLWRVQSAVDNRSVKGEIFSLVVRMFFP